MAPPPSTELIGRAVELEGLRGARAAAAAGAGGIVLLAGVAGIGKSRLLAEFGAQAGHGRWTLGVGFCRAFATAPYGALIEALASAGATPPAESGELALDALVAAALGVARRRSTVLALEDVHWADVATLHALVEIARRIAGSRLLVVATYRSDDVDPHSERYAAIARLCREPATRTLTLRPLAAPDARRLLRAGSRSAASPEQGALAAIEARSEGNPLFLEELLRHYIEEPGAPASLPLSVRGIFLARFLRLDVAARRVLAAAALFDRAFSAAALVELVPAGADDVLRALASARDAHLIVEAPDGFSFVHALAREAVAGELLAPQRRALHARIARALESGAGAADRVAEIAYHWSEARDVERAAQWCERAGDRASHLRAHDDAADYYRRTLDARAAGGAADDPALCEKLANALELASHLTEAREALERAVAAFAAAGDASRAAELALHAVFLEQLRDDLGEARDAVARVRAGVAPSPELATHAAVVDAYMHAMHGDERAARNALAAVAPPDPSACSSLAVRYWELAGFVALQSGDAAAWSAASETYARVARASGNECFLVEAHQNVAIGSCLCGEPQAESRLAEAARLALERGMPGNAAYVTAFAALDDYLRGRLAAGRARLHRAESIRHGWRAAQLTAAAGGMLLGYALADDELIERFTPRGAVELSDLTANPVVFGRTVAALAPILVGRREFERAQQLLEVAVQRLRGFYGASLLLPVVARHAPLPVAERARAIVAAAAQEPQHAVAHATLAHVDALLERRRAEIERSIANARLAADRYASLGWHFLRIEALELANDRPAALSLARALGAVGFARALSLQPAAPAAGASGAGALSERERAVAALVSEGKSNRAIARRLGCSEKSVERCLTGLYRKLGLHSRTELAGQKSRVSAQATYSEVL